jgi:UDP-N-acetyl-D-mannosaminuronate dehydrogenase
MKIVMKKDVVAGLGEIGLPILKILSKKENIVGYDLNEKLMDEKKFNKFNDIPTSFLHIAIPVTKKFDSNLIKLSKKFQPECIVIHSTIPPGTTEKMQKKLDCPLIFSAIRGVHKRMSKDMKRYTKFFALSNSAPKKEWAIKSFSKKMKNCGIKTKLMSTPETLELAKILCDTTYLGWLINYSQITNVIAKNFGVDYDEMWTFSDEIHKFLGNRPKMYPGYIGGHCVIPNLELINNKTLNLIKEMNDSYLKKSNPKSN